MRQKLVIGNWKLHGGLLENQVLLNRLKQELHDLPGVDTAVCLPYVYLYQAQALLQDSPIAWGAQNVSQFTEGAFTSCISAKMVAEFGCTYTIIGHSERRALKLESNQVATKRILNALHAGLTPIFCVGETLDERDGNMAELIVRNQMLNVVYGLDNEAFDLAKKFNMVIAYEPVWAIGTGEHATPEQAQRMHSFIRMMIAERDREFADQIRIVYGGSMAPKNAHSLLSMPHLGPHIANTAPVAMWADDTDQYASTSFDWSRSGWPAMWRWVFRRQHGCHWGWRSASGDSSVAAGTFS